MAKNKNKTNEMIFISTAVVLILSLIGLGFVIGMVYESDSQLDQLCVPQLAGVYKDMTGNNATIIVLDRNDALQNQLATEIERVWRNIVEANKQNIGG